MSFFLCSAPRYVGTADKVAVEGACRLKRAGDKGCVNNRRSFRGRDPIVNLATKPYLNE